MIALAAPYQPQFARVPSRAATAARPTHSHADRAATIIHDQTNGGRRVGRPVGGCDRHTSVRTGWTGDLNEIAAVRRLILAGIDERLAAHIVADQSGHQPSVHAFADVPPSHFEPLRRLVAVEATKSREALNAVHEKHKAGSAHDR